MEKSKKYAWLVLLSFGFTYLFFYNGRQNINLVMTQMAQDLNSSTAIMGRVSSALFWCYAFGQLINGRLGAFLGYKRLVASRETRLCHRICHLLFRHGTSHYLPVHYPVGINLDCKKNENKTYLE